MRLVVERARVEYPGLAAPVLDDADFSIAQGETVAVLGPSGSGKSTLLSVLGGIVAPTSGRAYVDDHAEWDLAAASAWILQTTNVLPERTARDNVALAALACGCALGAARDLAEELLAEVGLEHRANDSARVLSGGEVQRVVIARGLASGRPFLLADEPTGQLDADTSDRVLEAMFAARGRASGVGVVVVTHDLAVANRCGRIVRIDHGRVIAA